MSLRSCAIAALLLPSLGACVEHPDVVATRVEEAGGSGNEPPLVTLELTGDFFVNDPSIIRIGSEYRVFGTGTGISQRSSPDLRDFRVEDSVFAAIPAWVEPRVPGVTGFWSPDVSEFGGEYHLYYAVSTFGSERSCIGHATADDPLAANAWTDQGEVICSNADGVLEEWNAIDPNVFLDDQGVPWLVFGSYRTGIQLIRLDESGARADTEMITLWTRLPDNDAIQASSLFRHGSDFFLFASFDICCRGVDSTHKIMVGRARSLSGPYADKDGVALLEGGGSLVLEGNERFRGPGSNVLLEDGGRVYNVYHAYDVENAGRATLRIAEVRFDEDGWPVSAGP